MAKQEQISSRPWILEAVPLLVVILIAAHVLALAGNRETAAEDQKTLGIRKIQNELLHKSSSTRGVLSIANEFIRCGSL